MIKRFMSNFRIQYYFKPSEEMPPPYYDDVEENATDLLNRGLITMMLKSAVKNGDGVGIRAIKLVCIYGFLARDDKQNSKYAKYLLQDHIDFLGSDSLTKARIDRYATINTTGKPGDNKAHDTHMENMNLETQKMIGNMNSNLEPIQLEKESLASNISSMAVCLDKEVNGIDGGTGGGHADKKLSEDNINDIMEEIEITNPFSRRRPKIVFKQRMRTCWSGGHAGGRLSKENRERFLERNKNHYEENRLRRPY